MRKLKLVIVFVAAAIVSGALTLAPKVHAWYKQVEAIQCVPSQIGFGFAGPTTGDMWVSGYSVANTSERNILLTCPALWDSTNMWSVDDWTFMESMKVRATFQRWYPASQQPRIQVCGYWACSQWYYGDPALNSWARVYIDFWAGPWTDVSMNTVVVALDATYQDWGRVMFFSGFTVGNEFGEVMQ